MCLSIGIATSTFWYIVLPKVQRVRSGEKIVATTLMNSNMGTRKSSEQSPKPVSGLSDPETITISRNESLPIKLERQLLNLSEILRGVTFELAEGKTLRLDDWNTLIDEVSLLHNSLERVQFSWVVEDESSKKFETGDVDGP